MKLVSLFVVCLPLSNARLFAPKLAGAGEVERSKGNACAECLQNLANLQHTDCTCFASDLLGTFANDATKTSSHWTQSNKDPKKDVQTGADRLPEGWIWHCRPISSSNNAQGDKTWQQCPEPKSFAQAHKKSMRGLKHLKKGDDDDDDGDGFEHGDASTSLDEDSTADSDFSLHQFVTPDDARDGPSDDTPTAEAETPQAEDDDFDSDETPDANEDSFAQTQKKSQGKKDVDDEDDGDGYEHGDASTSLDEDDSADSDFSVHNLIQPDDARDGPDAAEESQADKAQEEAESEDDTFNSEDTPAEDQDSFIQKK